MTHPIPQLSETEEAMPSSADALFEVLARARAGAPLTTADLATIFRISRQHATKLAADGSFDQFRFKGKPVGTRHYSGALVARYLDAEPLAERTFAAPRLDRRKR